MWVVGYVNNSYHGIPLGVIITKYHNSEYLKKGLSILMKNVNFKEKPMFMVDKDSIELKSLNDLGYEKILCKVIFFSNNLQK